MKFLFFSFILIFISGFSYTGLAINYYVSSAGNDKNSGKSENDAWKSIDRVNRQNLSPGDTVFFLSGDVFKGELIIQYSGSKENPIVFTAFGKGKKPVLKGSQTITGFTSSGDNIYTAKTIHQVKNLYHDNKSMILARQPNKGFLSMDGGGADYLIDAENSYTANDLVGAGIIIRPLNWIYEIRTITGVDDKKIIYDRNLFMTSTHQTECQNGWGYYLQNSFEFLDSEGEWYYDPGNQQIYLYSSQPLPENFSVEASNLDVAVLLKKDVSHIVIKDMHFTYFHERGIKALGNNKDVRVKNSSLEHIFGIAIDGGLHASRFNISGNRINDINGRGISFLEATDCRVENNTLQRIGIIPGYGISGLNGGVGVLFTSREKIPANERVNSNNNYIGYNVVDSTGYISIRMDGTNSICEYNNVSNALLTLNDGALIYCWGGDTLFTRNNIIRNNIARYAHGNTEGTPSDHKMNIGIYIDNRANHIQVLNNYVEGVNSGIHVNDGAFDNILKNNTLYGNKTGISFAEFSKNNGVLCEGNTCTNNILFNTYNLGHTMTLKHTYESDFTPGIIDSNVYVSPNEMYHIKKETMENGCKITREFTFEAWIDTVKHDQQSRFVETPFGTKSVSFVNTQDKELEIILDENIIYKDMNGNSVAGKIKLAPFSSKILMYIL
ncbi:MAG: right-handed parallel beta-helix repeat-containing protein [Bacteroidota bacterium]